MAGPTVRLVMPHQLFEAHLDAPAGTRFVLVEYDLMFRQYRFHTQKLVLHRASMRRFATRLRERGFDVDVLETDGRTTSRASVAEALRHHGAARVAWYDAVDDWLCQDLVGAVADAGLDPDNDVEVADTPNFLTTNAQLEQFFGEHPARRGAGLARMQTFYAWQRRRLDVLVTNGKPDGGRWSFDEENRKKLPRDHPVPAPRWPDRAPEVDEAIAWVKRAFPENPGDAERFAWPTSHDEADDVLEQFLAERFIEFGPYEDALSTEEPWVFHSLLSAPLNAGLISPRRILSRALEVGAANDVPMPSLEGFVRQVIGWREYMRATYALLGRRLRTGNRLEHARPLAEGWWTAETGLAPVDHVVQRVLDHGWAHHIERLMVLGNAMCLLRSDPDAVYEWFMEMFVDAYDWVMVPNVYAMSQFAAGEAITTKPYVSGSNYLRKMSDYASADGDEWGSEWAADWDALYWTFVRDHRPVFEQNARSNFLTASYDRMDAAKKAAHTRRATPWLA